MSLSTHVLDLAAGRPAEGIAVSLEIFAAGQWTPIARAVTDINGRCGDLLSESAVADRNVIYRFHFETGTYFAARQESSLYPYVEIVFTMADDRHHHIPLLLAANGYTTYRGS